MSQMTSFMLDCRGVTVLAGGNAFCLAASLALAFDFVNTID